MSNQGPDNLFASPLDKVKEFAFDEAVARVFPDMIQRSVPGYTTIIPMIGLITQKYALNGSLCYDLGCSLGASTLAMRHGLQGKNCRLIGVDNSASMIERCHHYVELDNEQIPVELICDDIRTLELQPCSVVTLNFTLQFVPEIERRALLEKIANALIPGGALILSEKLVFDQPAIQSSLEDLHWLFKKANGYSELEIAQKRSAIENVLVPESLETHIERLGQAGFNLVTPWYQCFNFCSMLAVK